MDRHFLDERADIEILGEENITSVEADHLAQDTTNDPNWWKGIVDAQKDQWENLIRHEIYDNEKGLSKENVELRVKQEFDKLYSTPERIASKKAEGQTDEDIYGGQEIPADEYPEFDPTGDVQNRDSLGVVSYL